MSGRDPRVTPRAGDVLRHRSGRQRREVKQLSRGRRAGLVYVVCDGGYWPDVIPTLEQWRRWAAGAEVLRSAEEVQGG